MDKELRNLVSRYLERELPLEGFQQEFAALYFRVRNNHHAPIAASELCNAIIGPLAEMSRGHRSEDSLRTEWANAIRPFESNSNSATNGDFSFPIAESNADYSTNRVQAAA
jgi:hypothetical protein